VTNNKEVLKWINEITELTKPSEIIWIDGSEEQKKEIYKKALESGDLMELNQEKLPGCYLHRSNPKDTARVEDRTFICLPTKEDVGPTNNWFEPEEAKSRMNKLFNGVYSGRTMYIIPFIMGHPNSEFGKIGFEITDSLYVVASMMIMTRVGKVATDMLKDSTDFVKGLHSVGTLDEKEKYILHFPEEKSIISVNSGYGGNALLGKKCLSLRIASYLAQKENWLAEHMLILGIQAPNGDTKYVAAAFPSACGKTNLAMINPPKEFEGYKTFTIGDDIAWLRIGEDGRLWAVNPEAGFFGVAPGTSHKSNYNMMETISKNTIYTNVLQTEDNTVWWEGMTDTPPEKGTDWKGQPWTPESGEKGAHPNSRFTAPAKQCPCVSPEFDNPNGVPISAIIFGGRRSKGVPLVYEAMNWEHGVFTGASLCSETTAAAEGNMGRLRHDPMAMLPFCGYNMGDYFAHWLKMGDLVENPPKIFHVNWFGKDDDGNFLWPGFSDNFRILDWIMKRCENKAEYTETALGYMPYAKDINIEGTGLDEETFDKCLALDKEALLQSADSYDEFFKDFDRLPEKIKEQISNYRKRVENM